MIRFLSIIILSILTCPLTFGQNNDIMLNASSDSKPREISLGLPTNTLSAVQIFEDAMPVSYFKYQLFPYKSWHGGASAALTGKMNPMETSLRYGEINTYVSSHNKLFCPNFNSTFLYTIGSFGQHKIDLNVSGPISDSGLGYSVSSYQNIDPGSNHIKYPKYKDRHQFYKVALSKLLSNGLMALVYQHVDYLSMTENYGPFIFVGNGDVKELDGFSLGRDSYFPDIKEFSFKDCLTGEYTTMDLKDGNKDKTNHVTFKLDYTLRNNGEKDNVQLHIRSRFKNGRCIRGQHSVGGMEQVTEESNYSYADGSKFAGRLQRRTLAHYDSKENAWMNNVEIISTKESNIFRFGLDYHHEYTKVIVSSAHFAHEVKANPQMLYRDGQAFYNFNTSGEYYKGTENKAALYLKDEWKAIDGLIVEAFVRGESNNVNGEAAHCIGDSQKNARRVGYCVADGEITKYNDTYLNGAVGANINYRIGRGFSLMGQGIITRVGKALFDYGGYSEPLKKPTVTSFAQGGLAFVNNHVNIVSQIVYISQSNCTSRTMFQHQLQKEVNGNPVGFSETLTLPIKYGIQSIGWTTDAMINMLNGFKLHLQFAIRNPQYKDFSFSPTFSDGVTESYDFSNNNVTNLHKTEISIDPSYRYKRMNVWLSARYISKQYINRTNSLFFKERVETFGGIDFTFNEKVSTSLNIVNLLNQKGASGNITSADLVEDGSKYKNYMMAGTFIRPFTVELSIKVNLY